MTFLTPGHTAHRATNHLDPKDTGPLDQPTPPPARRYLPDTPYLLPKDEQESDRLTFQHHALFLALGNHYIAALDPGLRTILDVGCGTGIWAADMARSFPQALVVGVDLDPTLFRETPPFPPNCLLRVGDVLQRLPFPDRFFGYVHQRLLIYAIPAARWPAVLWELVRVTERGGVVECVEIDPVLQPQGPATGRMLASIDVVQRARGIQSEPIRQLGPLFEKAGLQEIEVQTIPLPLGEWGGRVGGLLKRDALGVFGALKERCCQMGGLDPQTFDGLLAQMSGEWEQYRTSCICYVAYGRRGGRP